MATVIPFPARQQRATRIDERAVLEAALEMTLDAVDHLVARLDELDNDPDLEDGGDDEPSLGTPAGGASQRLWAAGGDKTLKSYSATASQSCNMIGLRCFTAITS